MAIWFKKIVVGHRKSLAELNSGLPPHGTEAAHIQLFLRSSIGLVGVPCNRAVKAHGSGHLLRQLADAQVDSGAYV